MTTLHEMVRLEGARALPRLPFNGRARSPCHRLIRRDPAATALGRTASSMRRTAQGARTGGRFLHDGRGRRHRAIWAGDATKSVTFESSSMEANLTKFIDDVVPPDKGNGDCHSKPIAQMCRALYDRTSRAVTGARWHAGHRTLRRSNPDAFTSE